MVGMYFKGNKIGKQRIDMLRDNEVIAELIAVDVVQALMRSYGYFTRSDG